MTKVDKNNIVELLEDIKKLLVFLLYKNKVSTKEIGVVLGVSTRTIERVVSGKK